jgi:hypothetical protein
MSIIPSITGREHSKFVESPTRSGESAVEVVDNNAADVLGDILGALGGSVSFSVQIQNISTPLANTEYSYALPANCSGYILKARKICKSRLAFVSGETSTNYYSIGLGGLFEERSSVGGITLYFFSDVANNIFELIIYSKT